jgi:hypothetical protein
MLDDTSLARGLRSPAFQRKLDMLGTILRDVVERVEELYLFLCSSVQLGGDEIFQGM